RARAFLIEPADLGVAQEEDAPQDELGNALRMRFGVRERERAAPRSAEHLPLLDAEVDAQALDVGDQILRRVLVERRLGRAASAAALVEEGDAVAPGIEEAPRERLDSASRSAMQKDRRLAVRTSHFLVIEVVARGDLEPACLVGLDL